MHGAKHEVPRAQAEQTNLLISFDNGCLKIGKQIMEAPCANKAKMSPGK